MSVLKDKIFISVIIPAYNAAQTIEQAIESVARNLSDYEIIVVENGSTDNTSQFVESLVEKKHGIKVIHTEKGVSKARNEGIKAAKGDWIAFVDADDEWLTQQKHINKIVSGNEQADIICFNYFKGKNEVRIYNQKSKQLSENKLAGEIEIMLSNPTKYTTVWAKLFRRDFIVQNQILFDEELRVSEDSDFIIKCLSKCTKIITDDTCVYRYNLETGSTTRSIDPTRTKAYLSALRKVRSSIDKSTIPVSNDSLKNYTVAQLNLIAVHDVFDCDKKCKWGERLGLIRKITEDGIIKEAIEKLRIQNIKDVSKIPAFLFSNGAYSLGGAICYMRSIYNRYRYK